MSVLTNHGTGIYENFAILLFTKSEISKHQAFDNRNISNILEPLIWNLQRLNNTILGQYLPKNKPIFFAGLIPPYVNKGALQWFSCFL